MRKSRLLISFALIFNAALAQKTDTAFIRKELKLALDTFKKNGSEFTLKKSREHLPASIAFKNDELIARCYMLTGLWHDKQLNNDSAIWYFATATEYAKKTSSQKLTGLLYHYQASVHYRKGEYDKSMELFVSSKRAREAARDTVGLAWSEMNIGNIYYFQEGFDDALQHYLRARELFKSAGNLQGEGTTLGNIALVYAEKKMSEKAAQFYDEAIRINTQIGNKTALANNLSNLASMHFFNKEFAKSEEIYNKLLPITEELDDYYATYFCYSGLAALASRKKDFKKAEHYLRESLKLCEKSGDRQLMKMVYKAMSEYYSETGNYKSAYEWLLKHKNISDSVNYGDKLAEVEAKYGKEKQEKEIALLKQANQINELEIRRKQIIIYASVAVGLLLLILGVIFLRNYNQKKKANRLLETKNKEINEQKNVIELKQKEVLDSINYAKKIQRTLTGSDELLKKFFPQSFIFFQPKDIVSGDFYYTAEKENRFYIAVCDSTGHGVPGAFMSLLNSNFLNEAIIDKGIKEPHLIFNYVRERLISSLSKDGSQDGMDAVLFCFEKNNSPDLRASYVAANIKPLLISGNSVTTLNADKMPVGKGIKNESFSLHQLEIKSGDKLYLYTDGFADQFGGDKGKKFKYTQLAALLKSVSELKAENQHEKMKDAFHEWKKNLEQVDDVCLIGLIL